MYINWKDTFAGIINNKLAVIKSGLQLSKDKVDKGIYENMMTAVDELEEVAHCPEMNKKPKG
jgi:hypothetical protein